MKCMIFLLLIGSLGWSHVQGSTWSTTKNILLENMPTEVHHFDSVSEYYGKPMVSAIEKKIEASASYGEDFDGIMKAARDIVNENKVATTDRNKNFYKALNVFASLSEAVNQCDYNGYMVLAENYRAASAYKNQLEPTNVVNTAILEAINRHGDNCRPVYLEKFREEYSKMSQELKDKIDSLVDSELIEASFCTNDFLEVLRTKYFPIGFSAARHVLVKKLKQLYKKNNSEIEEDESIAAKYIIDPCIEFRDQLAGVFYPARLDLALDQTKINEIDSESDQESSFKKTWIKFKFCDGVDYHPGLFQSELDNASIIGN